MCGSKKTYITNTGLGDDQYKALTDNQGNLGTQIEEGFTGVGGSLTGISNDVSGLNTKADALQTSTNTGFTSLSDLLKTYGDGLTKGQADAASGRTTYYNNLLTALQNNTGGLKTALDAGFTTTQNTMDKGFANADQQFNELDNSVSNVQNSVDTGFTNTQSQMTDFRGEVSDGFASAGDALSKGFADTRGDVATLQAEALGGQQNILSDLATAKAERDAYQAVNSDAVNNMQSSQDTFKSDFDKYVKDYGTNATMQNETLGNITQGLNNFAGDVSKRLNTVNRNVLDTSAIDALAAQTGNASKSLSNQLGASMNDMGGAIDAQGNTISDVLSGGFKDVNATVNDGLRDVSADVTGGFKQADANQNALTSDLGNLRNMLQSGNSNLSAELSSGMQEVSSAFDAQGNLISSGFDQQGNQITRAFDQQGNLITSTTDATGKEIGRVSTNVLDVFRKSQEMERSLAAGFGDLRNENSGLMSEMEANRTLTDSVYNRLNSGFGTMQNNLSGLEVGQQQMAAQLPGMMKTLSQVAEMPMEMRQQFSQVSDAFDQQGNLVKNSIDAQGNTISRALDAQGNLILSKFDVTGNSLGRMTLNMKDMASQIQNLKSIPGASANMGRLSAPLQDLGTGQGGFMSPYGVTQ